MTASIDVLAFGAHPDDVELCVGGTVLRLVELGYRVGIVDMTRGELGTRGTPERRAEEAAEAARRLGVSLRRNLELPDGHVQRDDESLSRTVRAIRQLTPRLVLAPADDDLHPDHAWTGRIVKEAAYLAGIARWKPEDPPHRPDTVLRYMSHTVFEPDLVIDVTSWFETKRQACLAYASQFHDPASTEPETYISGSRFWDWWEARARNMGHRIGATFGEGFLHDGPIPLTDPVATFSGFGYYPRSGQASASEGSPPGASDSGESTQ